MVLPLCLLILLYEVANKLFIWMNLCLRKFVGLIVMVIGIIMLFVFIHFVFRTSLFRVQLFFNTLVLELYVNMHAHIQVRAWTHTHTHTHTDTCILSLTHIHRGWLLNTFYSYFKHIFWNFISISHTFMLASFVIIIFWTRMTKIEWWC